MKKETKEDKKENGNKLEIGVCLFLCLCKREKREEKWWEDENFASGVCPIRSDDDEENCIILSVCLHAINVKCELCSM